MRRNSIALLSGLVASTSSSVSVAYPPCAPGQAPMQDGTPVCLEDATRVLGLVFCGGGALVVILTALLLIGLVSHSRRQAPSPDDGTLQARGGRRRAWLLGIAAGLLPVFFIPALNIRSIPAPAAVLGFGVAGLAWAISPLFRFVRLTIAARAIANGRSREGTGDGADGVAVPSDDGHPSDVVDVRGIRRIGYRNDTPPDSACTLLTARATTQRSRSLPFRDMPPVREHSKPLLVILGDRAEALQQLKAARLDAIALSLVIAYPQVVLWSAVGLLIGQ